MAADGQTLFDDLIVTNDEAGLVKLSKPSRIVTFETSGALFEDQRFRVVSEGARYCIERKRDAFRERQLFATAEQAKAAILKRQPQQERA